MFLHGVTTVIQTFFLRHKTRRHYVYCLRLHFNYITSVWKYEWLKLLRKDEAVEMPFLKQQTREASFKLVLTLNDDIKSKIRSLMKA